jgi:hypothetical protein
VLVRREVAAVGLGAAAAGGDVRGDGGGAAAARDLPGWLREDACAAAGLAAVAAPVRRGGGLRGAGAARGRAEGGGGGGAAAAAVAGLSRPVLVCAGLHCRIVARFASRAGWLRAGLAGLLPLVDPLGRVVAPAGSVIGDALAALDAVTAGLRRGFPGLATVAAHEVAAHLTGGLLLAPGLPPLAGNTTLAGLAAVCSS